MSFSAELQNKIYFCYNYLIIFFSLKQNYKRLWNHESERTVNKRKKTLPAVCAIFAKACVNDVCEIGPALFKFCIFLNCAALCYVCANLCQKSLLDNINHFSKKIKKPNFCRPRTFQILKIEQLCCIVLRLCSFVPQKENW